MKTTARNLGASLACLLLLSTSSHGEDSDESSPREVEYARVGEHALKMDIYIPPANKLRSPFMVWVHGGAWRSGSKNSMPLKRLVAEGYPVASVEYRLSTEAKFPAQIHDIKAAIRYLRHGHEWDTSAKELVVAGDSAGGHLAALVGVSNGHTELEGEIGTALDRSSRVQGIISFYGASNLTTILQQSTPHGLSVRVPALDLFLGGQPEKLPALAQLASPVFHVERNDPPLLLLHGDQDPQMPVNQALELWGAYRKAAAPVQLEVVHGGVHGGELFYDEERLAIVKRFLEHHFPINRP